MPADGCCAAADHLTFADVEELLRASFAAVAAETLALDAAIGRVLAEPVMAIGDMPPFDSAAMDGFAVRRDDLYGPGPWRLPISLRTVAGDAAGFLPSGHCARIFTGAPVPKGADCVVMQEHVQLNGSDALFRGQPEAGTHTWPSRKRSPDLAMAGVFCVFKRVCAKRLALASTSGDP